jgi:hypothetical protein
MSDEAVSRKQALYFITQRWPFGTPSLSWDAELYTYELSAPQVIITIVKDLLNEKARLIEEHEAQIEHLKCELKTLQKRERGW